MIEILIEPQIYLLAKLINSECEECTYEEKLLVGSVVLNRMSLCKCTMEEVIFKPNQFYGICNTRFNLTAESLKVAAELLMNQSINKEILYFYTRGSPNKKWRKNLKTIIKSQFHNFAK